MEATFTVSEAAKACGVSRKTITRRLPDLAQHGATKSAQGWLLPVSSLLAVGLQPGKPSDASVSATPRAEAEALVTIPRDEYEALRAKQAQADRLAAELEHQVVERRFGLVQSTHRRGPVGTDLAHEFGADGAGSAA